MPAHGAWQRVRGGLLASTGYPPAVLLVCASCQLTRLAIATRSPLAPRGSHKKTRWPRRPATYLARLASPCLLTHFSGKIMCTSTHQVS